MFDFFRTKKTIIPNIAQIVIIVILFPFISIIFGQVFPNVFDIKEFIADSLSTIPLLECSVDLLYQIDSSQLDITRSSTGFFDNVSVAFLEAIIIAIILKIVVEFHNYLRRNGSVRGAPILATFIATIISTIVLALIGKTVNGVYLILTYILLIAIFLFGMKFLLSSVFKPRGFRLFSEIVIILIGAVSAACISGYATVHMLLISHSFVNTAYGILCLLVYTVVSIISVILMYWSEKIFK